MQKLTLGTKNFVMAKFDACAKKKKERSSDAGKMILEVAHNLDRFFRAQPFTYPEYEEVSEVRNKEELVPLVKMIYTYIGFSDADKDKFASVLYANSIAPKKALAISHKMRQNQHN